jgi:hypothetical protein
MNRTELSRVELDWSVDCCISCTRWTELSWTELRDLWSMRGPLKHEACGTAKACGTSEACGTAKACWTACGTAKAKAEYNSMMRVNCLVGSFYTSQQNVHNRHQYWKQTPEIISDSEEYLPIDELPQLQGLNLHRVPQDHHQITRLNSQTKWSWSRFEPVWGERTNRDWNWDEDCLSSLHNSQFTIHNSNI